MHNCTDLGKYLTLALAFAIFVPFWAFQRMGAVLAHVSHPETLMRGVEVNLSVATVPFSRFPWYYDVNAVRRFVDQKQPYAEFQPGEPDKAEYVHIPPSDPGLAIALRFLKMVVGQPVSLRGVVQDQVALDALVFTMVGLICFQIGGLVGGILGLAIYAVAGEIAWASTYPYYYYWPVPLSVALLGIFSLMSRENQKRWPLLAFSSGLIVGTWCWFRGNAITLSLVLPIVVGIILHKRKAALAGAAYALVGTLVALSPSIIHGWLDHHSPLPRVQTWHTLFVGIGSRPNPYGIVYEDEYAFKLAKSKYGAEFRTPAYEEALRTEYLKVVRENPGLIIRNFFLNLFDGFVARPFDWFPLGVMHTLCVGALLGVVCLFRDRSQQRTVLLIAFAIWSIQLSTLSFITAPTAAYLWESMGVAVICGAGGFGAAVEFLLRRLGFPSLRAKALAPLRR